MTLSTEWLTDPDPDDNNAFGEDPASASRPTTEVNEKEFAFGSIGGVSLLGLTRVSKGFAPPFFEWGCRSGFRWGGPEVLDCLVSTLPTPTCVQAGSGSTSTTSCSICSSSTNASRIEENSGIRSRGKDFASRWLASWSSYLYTCPSLY